MLTAVEQLLLHNVSWGTYRRLLRDLEQHHLRSAYDGGTLWLVRPSFLHHCRARFLGRLLLTLTEERHLPVAEGGSTTLFLEKEECGLDPDGCFWIANERLIRGKKTLDLRRDPPPDLAIEMHVASSPINRLAVYAALSVPEVWRFDGTRLRFHILQPTGEYKVQETSSAVRGIASVELLRRLNSVDQMGETGVIREFRRWIQQVHSPS